MFEGSKLSLPQVQAPAVIMLPVMHERVAMLRATSPVSIDPRKLRSPEASAKSLPRERLLAQLTQDQEARLILLRAASGFGKTTLLQQYRQSCEDRGQSTLWLSLDATDNDPECFLAHLHAGLDALDLPQVAVADSGQALLARIARAATPLVMLLDGYEAIRTPAVDELVSRLLVVLPAHMQLVIASRAASGIALGRLRAQRLLCELDATALAFSEQETRQLLDQECLDLDEQALAELLRSTEGWPVALQMATLSRRDGCMAPALAEYFSEVVLAGVDAETREFLQQTCVLDRLCVPACEALTGSGDARSMLLRLERAGLFLFPLGDGGYRYHALFAEFLRATLQHRQPHGLHELHLRAARWSLDNGQPAAAIEHLLQAREYEAVFDRLEPILDQLIDEGRLRTLARWFDQLPAAAVARRPRLALVQAWIRVLEQRYQDTLQLIDRQAFSLESESLRCLLLVFTDQFEAAHSACLQHIERLPPGDSLHHGLLAISLAYCQIGLGEHGQARLQLSRLVGMATTKRATIVDNLADTLDSILDLTEGRLGSALVRLRTLASRPRAGGCRRWEAGSLARDIVRTALLYEADELEEARRILTGIPRGGRFSNGADAMISAQVLLARMALLDGDRPAWQRHLAELEQAGRRCGLHRVICAVWLERARVATLERRFDLAAQALHSADNHADWMRPELRMYASDVDDTFVARQRLGIARGQFAEAADELAAALAAALRQHRQRRALKLRLLLAMALAGLDRDGEAFTELTEALRLAAHEGFIRSFLDEGAGLARLLQRWAVVHQTQASSLGVRPEFLAGLLRRFGVAAVTGVSGAVEAAAHLTSRELDVLRLLAAGHRNRNIAERMSLSEHTVKTHLRNINAKLGANGRTAAIAIARALQLLD
ncbi:LuxR C-terminal-related transcriptional regulator [Pseudomonas sp. LS44]|uniref:LuxR C-terminal-related transcriptional regulator n=1 Tax=Pseudomonas sp. LS44 TaxID=1357074 RepID=UPI00215AAEAF|nr:LuxR C-terminal-related transcriptional regulator [Pseudomonas sp. LS44]UVE16005.1 LuxR C-terminal-related transcriptional regulator [Pseudomonas sp. LS44]